MSTEQRNAIWVASYPKSGNTWVHDVLRTAGKAWGFPPGPMDIYDMMSSGRKPEVCTPVLPEYASHPCSVLKTHGIPVEGKPLHRIEGLALHTAGFIYVYRNPLDLLLSYINFTRIEYAANSANPGYGKALFGEILGMDRQPDPEEWKAVTLDDLPRDRLDHALNVYSERGLTLPTCFPNLAWSRHVRAWMDEAERTPSVVMRYEDCVADRHTFDRMAKFFTFGAEDIQKALDSSRERTSRVMNDGTRQERIFFNKMQAYYYPQYFSEEAVAGFVRRHGDALEEFGYGRIVQAVA